MFYLLSEAIIIIRKGFKMTNNFSTISENLKAGKSAYSPFDLNKLMAEIQPFLLDLTSKIAPFTAEEITDLLNILEPLIEGEMEREFCEALSPETVAGIFDKLLISDNTTDTEKVILAFLDIFRFSEFLVKIYGISGWDQKIELVIEKSNYTFGKLFSRRVSRYKNKTLFCVLNGKNKVNYSWNEVSKIVANYSQSLSNNLNNKNSPVAFLLENSPEMAFLDLACLTSGIVNVMIPANSVPAHIEFILNKTASNLIFVHDEQQLSKIKSIRKNLKHSPLVVLLQGNSTEEWVINFQKFLRKTEISANPKSTIRQTSDTATVMFTSGTTGDPKGIIFTDKNIVYKRFCRALAIPKIGDNDIFLAYLPLFHTFGRYLEMTGSVFLGAEYVFMENPAVETLIANMKFVKPSVFISIPKKWSQIYEYISSKTDLETASPAEIRLALENATGGNLRWGLSAAGYLDPEVFLFMQNNGVELLSGFGMTEATGGITMTPPGEYVRNSIGKPLPGINIKLGEDGELLVKGGYVMKGYFGEAPSETFDNDGWFPTGDIMRMDKNGYIEIIDRKKEIYKNIKGETIAPQKIENFFRDFDSVKQVFLVGDHRPFNTILIVPEMENLNPDLDNLDKIRDYYSSMVVGVNQFLAPFERIVDFRIADRTFSAEKGELTPKGTYKRKVIEANFKDTIEQMYLKPFTELYPDNIPVRLPNWFLREKGCLSTDVISIPGEIAIPKSGISLLVKRSRHKDKKIIKIGSYLYETDYKTVDLQNLLINPLYWIGNKELVDFCGESIVQWYRNSNPDKNLRVVDTVGKMTANPHLIENMNEFIESEEISLWGLHNATLILQMHDINSNFLAVRYLKKVLQHKNLQAYKPALNITLRPYINDSVLIRREMFKLAVVNKAESINNLFRLYFGFNADLLDENLTQFLVEEFNDRNFVRSIEETIDLILHDSEFDNHQNKIMSSLIHLLGAYGILHPTSYELIRQVFVKYQLLTEFPHISVIAGNERTRMREGFRGWLGENHDIAVDIETGEEYRWRDVMIFEQDIDPDDKDRITGVITKTAVLREAIFLLSDAKIIMLANIPPGGVWVSHLRTYHDKVVYRVSVQTRMQGSFEFVLNLNKKLSVAKVREEVNWLILAGSRHFMHELVEDFGGYWEDFDLWSGKFVAGDTVDRYLQRELKRQDESSTEKIAHLWPFFVWNASAAFFNFWKLTGYRLKLGDCSPGNFIIAPHDYQSGTKVVSFSEREAYSNIAELFQYFMKNFVSAVERNYPSIINRHITNYVFSGLINTEGERKGLEILSHLKQHLIKNTSELSSEIMPDLDSYLDKVTTDGFIPKQLYFSIKRFHRWFKLNSEASFEAQAEMLNDLYSTYQLTKLDESYPGSRLRFFLDTIFTQSSQSLINSMKEIFKKYRTNTIQQDEFRVHLSALENEFELSDREKYFITRLSYPHLRPGDTAALLAASSEGFNKTNLVVKYEDYEGETFYIRQPISPKEISKLHQLFQEVNLDISFKPEHEFLVAVSERGFIIGGLFYSFTDAQTVFMDKIVVAGRYRKKGISDKLMNELFNRLPGAGVTFVTTGFFRPEYFYRFGFKIERKYSGLVKTLTTEN